LESGTTITQGASFGGGRSALARGCDRLEENQRAEVQVIARGDSEIQRRNYRRQWNLKLWQALGLLSTEVRSPKSAIEVYEQILAARQVGRSSNSGDAKLAELHLSWFNYRHQLLLMRITGFSKSKIIASVK